MGRSFHAIKPDGEVLHGVPVFREAYEIVDQSWVWAATKIPVIRKLASFGYEIFAQIRTPITRGSSVEDLIEKHNQQKQQLLQSGETCIPAKVKARKCNREEQVSHGKCMMIYLLSLLDCISRMNCKRRRHVLIRGQCFLFSDSIFIFGGLHQILALYTYQDLHIIHDFIIVELSFHSWRIMPFFPNHPYPS